MKNNGSHRISSASLDEMLGLYEHRKGNLDSFEASHLNALLMQAGKAPIANRNALVDMGANLQTHPNMANGDKAQFTINVSRATAAIATSLEIPIFGAIHFASGYVDRINPSPGGSFTVTGGVNVAGFNDVVRVSHTVGVNTDITTISCNEVPYPTFLNSQLSDLFLISNIRYSLNDPTQLTQFAQAFEIRQKSLFGAGSQNPISPVSFKNPDQFQAGIIDLPCNIPIDKETYIVVDVAPLVISFSLAIFVQRFSKHDKVSMKPMSALV